jgi:hypothetical protein
MGGPTFVWRIAGLLTWPTATVRRSVYNLARRRERWGSHMGFARGLPSEHGHEPQET